MKSWQSLHVLLLNLFKEPSGAADDSNEDEENDVTVEDVDTPTGRLSMNDYGVKP